MVGILSQTSRLALVLSYRVGQVVGPAGGSDEAPHPPNLRAITSPPLPHAVTDACGSSRPTPRDMSVAQTTGVTDDTVCSPLRSHALLRVG
ncbi:hypothetical protein GW17_00029288 [Ensete ventricosum]|nr:hypothetical protein GW17_00029288 [Ensete ventricosum]